MKRNHVLILATLLLAPLFSVRAADAARPNVLIILADDMGFSDAGCYGGEIQTPNLDRLAANGIRFTQFYNTARCWPSRSALLTGYYAQAMRRDKMTGFKLPPEAGQPGIRGVRQRWAPLLAEYLKPLGYRSYVSGKWHIDGNPLNSGFDRAFLDMNGNGFFAQVGATEDGKPLPNIAPDGAYYSTIGLADHVIGQLKDHAANHAKQPFFQYVAFHAPHFPIQALPGDIAVYKNRYDAGWDVMRAERLARMKKLGIVDCELGPLEPDVIPGWNLSEAKLQEKIGTGEVGHAVAWEKLTDEQKKFQSAKMSVHAAMVHRMDIEIGRILEQIKTMGALDNTIVFFLSDNGASAEQMIRGLGEDPKAPIGSAHSFLGMGPGWATAANTPFRLHKTWNHEGGISTPLIVCWPAGIKTTGELRKDSGHVIDVVPTVLELVGVKQPATIAGMPVPPFHGISLVPDFARDGMVKHDFIWWNHEGNRAIRIGDWKLVANGEKPWELFDLSKDRSEIKNLAAEFPDKAKAMEREWTRHAEEMQNLAVQDPPSKGGKKTESDAGKTAE